MARDGLLKQFFSMALWLTFALSAWVHADPPSYTFSQIATGLEGQVEEYWLEPEGATLTWQQAIAQASWQPVGGELNMGYEQDKIWVRQMLNVSQPGRWIAHISYPLLDYLDIYLLRDQTVVKRVFTGDARLFHSRERLLNDFAVQLAADQPGQWQLLIRIETEGTLLMPLTWWDEADYNRWVLQHNMLFGGFYAVMLAMAIYNLFIFLIIRERSYLYYVATVISLMAVQLGFDGRGFAWLWPNTPHINSWYFPVAYCLYQLASLTFMDEFLKLSRNSRFLSHYFLLLRFIALINLILIVFLPYEIIVPIIVLTGVAAMLSGLIVGAILWLRGFTAARYFTLAWGGFLTGMLLVNFRGLGMFESTALNTYGYLIGSLIEVILLSFSLADRIASSQREKRQSEKALIEEQLKHVETLKRYEDLYENAPIGNFQSDLSHQLVSVNDMCAKIFGFSSNEQMVREVTDIRDYMLSSYAQYKVLIKHVVKYGHITDRELKIRDHEGQSKWISTTIRLTKIDGGNVLEGSVIDITERKNAEIKRQEMEHERLHVMEKFSLGIAKEINTPLGSNAATTAFIKENLDEIIESNKQGEVRFNQLESFLTLFQQSLNLIQQNQRRLIRVVKRFREVSAQHFGMQLTLFNLRDLLNEAIEARRWHMAGWRVNLDCDEKIVLHSYRRALLLIIDQVLENATVHGLGENGETNVSISAKLEGGTLALKIWDQGSGVNEEILSKLVQPFFTTKRGPLGHIGLGLYMVYNLVTRLLKGKVDLYNQKGAGLAVMLTMPAKLDE